MKLFHLSMIKKSISTTNQVHLIQTHQMHFIKGLFLYVQSLKPSGQKKKNWQKHPKTRTPFRTRTVNIYPPDNLLISNFHSPMINLLPASRSVDQSFFGKASKRKGFRKILETIQKGIWNIMEMPKEFTYSSSCHHWIYVIAMETTQCFHMFYRIFPHFSTTWQSKHKNFRIPQLFHFIS